MNLLLRATSRWLKKYSPDFVKGAIWDREFQEGKWAYLDRTSGGLKRDVTYELIEKYCRYGDILDLGCGTGKLAAGLNLDKYRWYAGVDISRVAISYARMDAAREGRSRKNVFTVSDITRYVPARKYNVISFIESLYYLPSRAIMKTLDHYLHFLTANGVILVRVYRRGKYAGLINRIYVKYDVIEEQTNREGRCSVVFRARS